MNEKNFELHLNVDRNNMQIKNYMPLALGYGHIEGKWNGEINRKYIEKIKFRNMLKNQLKVSKNRVKIVIDTFIELGFLKDDGKNYILENVDGVYITLHADTVRFCLKHFSNLDFKVYCYLKNKWEIHEHYKYKENYFFSENDILEMLGYSKSARNHVLIRESLLHLEKENLISFCHKSVGRPGYHGKYLELYYVNEFAASQVQARKQIVLDNVNEITSKEENISIKEKILRQLESNPDSYVNIRDITCQLLNMNYMLDFNLIDKDLKAAKEEIYRVIEDME